MTQPSKSLQVKRIWSEAMFDIEDAFRIWNAEQKAIDRGIHPK